MNVAANNRKDSPGLSSSKRSILRMSTSVLPLPAGAITRGSPRSRIHDILLIGCQLLRDCHGYAPPEAWWYASVTGSTRLRVALMRLANSTTTVGAAFPCRIASRAINSPDQPLELFRKSKYSASTEGSCGTRARLAAVRIRWQPWRIFVRDHLNLWAKPGVEE